MSKKIILRLFFIVFIILMIIIIGQKVYIIYKINSNFYSNNYIVSVVHNNIEERKSIVLNNYIMIVNGENQDRALYIDNNTNEKYFLNLYDETKIKSEFNINNTNDFLFCIPYNIITILSVNKVNFENKNYYEIVIIDGDSKIYLYYNIQNYKLEKKIYEYINLNRNESYKDYIIYYYKYNCVNPNDVNIENYKILEEEKGFDNR